MPRATPLLLSEDFPVLAEPRPAVRGVLTYWTIFILMVVSCQSTVLIFPP